jgi:cytochrome P450
LSDGNGLIPPGPTDGYRTTDDLLEWMSNQFLRFGDIYKASAYGGNLYAVRNPEFAHHVLVDNWQNYVKGQFIKRVAFLMGSGLVVSEGELWKRQRRTMQPLFRSKSIAGLTKMMVDVNLALLGRWQLAAEKHDSINVTRDVSGMVLEVVLRFILGDDYEQMGCRFHFLAGESLRDFAFARMFRDLSKTILQVAARRRKDLAAPTGVLGFLMEARDPRDGQQMSDGQLVNEILTLIIAGHETTANTLNWTWYLLSQHPDVEQRLSFELDGLNCSPEFEDLPRYPYSQQIIDESLRLYPAVWLMTRKALHDDRLGNYFVPAGIEIYIPPYFIQRHPEIWQDPDRFDPDRFAAENLPENDRLAMIPFSAGPRNCIGEFFSRVEMQIHLLTIARHLRLRYVQSKPLEIDAGVNLRNKYDFIMYPEIKRNEFH